MYARLEYVNITIDPQRINKRLKQQTIMQIKGPINLLIGKSHNNLLI